MNALELQYLQEHGLEAIYLQSEDLKQSTIAKSKLLKEIENLKNQTHSQEARKIMFNDLDDISDLSKYEKNFNETREK